MVTVANPRHWVNATQAYTSSLVSVSVLDFVERTPFLMFQGAGRGATKLAGEWGRPYRIQLRNLTAQRLLVVVSVDGINVVSGESANPRQSGYILPAHGEVRIDGWRKTMSEVAQFVFAEPGDSYAERTDRPHNEGGIGFAVFKERKQPALELDHRGDAYGREVPAPRAPQPRGASLDAMKDELFRSNAAEAAPQAKMGTGHGSRETSHATRGEFERASATPAEVIRLDYASMASLEAQGIARRRQAPSRPDPFPGDFFVPDPPRY